MHYSWLRLNQQSLFSIPKLWLIRTIFVFVLFCFFLMKTHNFQEHFYLKVFWGSSTTKYAKGIQLPWLYFTFTEAKHEHRELMPMCCGPVKIIYISVEWQSERLQLSTKRVPSLETLHKQGLAPCPSWGITMKIKKKMIFNYSPPHPQRYRMILHRNYLLLSQSNQSGSFSVFKYLHKPKQLQ